jgi:hypothetical protein
MGDCGKVPLAVVQGPVRVCGMLTQICTDSLQENLKMFKIQFIQRLLSRFSFLFAAGVLEKFHSLNYRLHEE